METRSRVTPREKREVLPTAPKEEGVKFGSGNTWGRKQLSLLGVDFYIQRRIDLNRVLGVRESDWPPELRERIIHYSNTHVHMLGVSAVADQLASVDMTDLNDGIIEIDDVRKRLAPDFVGTFSSLSSIMEIQETKERAKQAKQARRTISLADTSETTLKRAAEPSVATFPAKRARPTSNTPSPPSEPKTPDNPTHPSDPNWTGASIESKDEENTKMLLKLFLMNTMTALEADFRRVLWQRSGYRVELCQTYVPGNRWI